MAIYQLAESGILGHESNDEENLLTHPLTRRPLDLTECLPIATSPEKMLHEWFLFDLPQMFEVVCLDFRCNAGAVSPEEQFGNRKTEFLA